MDKKDWEKISIKDHQLNIRYWD